MGAIGDGFEEAEEGDLGGGETGVGGTRGPDLGDVDGAA